MIRLARIAAAISVVAVASLGGSALVGAHGGDGSLVHTCVANDGTLTLVGANDTSCATPLDWAQAGRTGAAGATGPAGDPGARGAAGRGLELHEVTATTTHPSDKPRLSAEASCPAGEYAVGGGYAAPTVKVVLRESQATLGLHGWRVEADVYSPAKPPSLTVTAVCARVAAPPSYTPVKGPPVAPSRCASLCVPTTTDPRRLATDGVPVLVVVPRGGASSVTVTVTCVSCARSARGATAVAAAAGRVTIGRVVVRRPRAGRLALGVRTSRAAARVLRSARRGRVVVRVVRRPRGGGRPRTSTASIRLQRQR